MADISKIVLPSGSEYNIKDAEARSQIAALTGGDAVVFVGVSSVELTDGGTQTPKINGENKIPAAGQLFFYGTQEFIWGPDSKWHALGSLDSLGDLAYKDSATGTYKPEGTISIPTFTGSNSTFTGAFEPAGSVTVSTKTTSNKTATVSAAASGTTTYTPGGDVSAPTISVKTAGATQTIKNPTSVTVAKTVVAAAPGATAPANNLTYYSVTDETLSLYQLGYTTGASITTANVDVKTDDAVYEASAPVFTGTAVRLVTGNIPVPATYDASFTGTSDTVSVSGIPNGSNSQPTFDGTSKNVTVQ